MDTHSQFTTFVAALACAGLATGQTPVPAQTEKPGLNMTISLKQKTVKPGAEVIVSIDVVNISDKTLMVRRNRPPSPYTVQIVDGAGKEFALTDLGRVLVGGGMTTDAKGNRRMVLGDFREGGLAAGKTLHEEVEVSRIYDLSQPGEYTIRFQRTDPATRLTISSNTVTLIISN